MKRYYKIIRKGESTAGIDRDIQGEIMARSHFVDTDGTITDPPEEEMFMTAKVDFEIIVRSKRRELSDNVQK